MASGSRRPLWAAWLWSTLVLEALVVVALVLVTSAPLGLSIVGVATVVTFAVYGWDKSCAQRDAPRVPERALFGLTLCGGGVGALVARRAFHHKTAKQQFTVVIAVGLVVVAALIAASSV